MTGHQSSESVEPATVVLPINGLLGLNDDHELAKVLLFEPMRESTSRTRAWMVGEVRSRAASESVAVPSHTANGCWSGNAETYSTLITSSWKNASTSAGRAFTRTRQR
jgi:hypothetical protein